MKPATYGETIEVHTTVEEWAAKTFRHRHVIRRGERSCCAKAPRCAPSAQRDPANPDRIKAHPIPEDIKASAYVPS
jgi:4-hydroxybenzoyl-CoA thioesterase